jgi:hypothetical protein
MAVFFVAMGPVVARADTAGLTALNETELAAVSGQQGVLINISLRNNVDASNAPIACTVLVGTPNPCRFGLQFGTNAASPWLMLKEYYGTFQVKDLRLDVGFLPLTSTAYADASRFKSVAGTCLLSTADCLPHGTATTSFPVIKFTYPDAEGAGIYNDFLSFLNIGRVWLENNYTLDSTLNSTLGVRMSDSSALNAAAKMRFVGTGYVYGF